LLRSPQTVAKQRRINVDKVFGNTPKTQEPVTE
jgi:hypothetical protein